ncbi:MAG: hypothetical protein KAU28_01130 [Phycisphaerae bacterium]|nr:hypothetical protein [Phycisphaerae bacterium]
MAEATPTAILGTDWKDGDVVRDFVASALALKEEYNLEIERQAELNNHWVQGRQQLFWHQGLERVVQQENPNERVRITFNMLWPAVEALVAKLAAVGSAITAQPATDDVADYDAAFNQAHLLRHYMETLDWPWLVERWDRESIVCMETFAKVVWDPLAGDPYSSFKPEDVGMELADFKEQFGVADVRGLHQGDVVVVPRTIFEIFWGPLGTHFEQAEWMLEVCDRSKAHAKQRYGLAADALEPSFAAGTKVWGGGVTSPRGTSEREADPNKVRIATLWVRVNPAIPGLEKGRYVVVVGGQVAVNVPNPYDHGQIPIVRYPLLYVPAEVRSATWVTSALPMQREANQALGQACEARERVGNPRIWAQEASIVDETQLVGSSGGLIEYRGSQVPVERPGSDTHRSAATALETAKFGIDELSGIRAVSHGRAGPSVRSAAQVSLLQNQDDERLATVAKNRRRFHVGIGRLMLATAHQFMSEERMIRVAGEESAQRTMLFNRDMLGARDKPIRVDRYNVRVVPDMPPRSRGALRLDLDTVMSRGFLDPKDPDHQQFVYETMQMGVARREPDRRKRASALQHKRNRMMAAGEYEPPRWFEPLELMTRELRRFQIDDVYAQLSARRQALFIRYDRELTRQRVFGQVYQQAVIREAMVELGINPDQGAGGASGGRRPPGASAPGRIPPRASVPGRGIPQNVENRG